MLPPTRWEDRPDSPNDAAPETLLDVRIVGDGDMITLVARGNLDVYTAPTMREHLESLDVTWGSVCIDLRDVALVDSMGLAALVSIANRAQRHERRVRLRCSPQLMELLEMTGLFGVFILEPVPAAWQTPSAA